MKKRLKNNRGFSLVELIIVIAIMVALVGVMAPQFMKYVTKARDAVIEQSAQDVLAFVKSEYSAGYLSGDGKIRVAADGNGIVHVKVENNCTLKYVDDNNNVADFSAACGVDGNKHCKSNIAYEIEIVGSSIGSQKIDIKVTQDSSGYRDFTGDFAD